MAITEPIGLKILIEALGYCLKSMSKSSMSTAVDSLFAALKLIQPC